MRVSRTVLIGVAATLVATSPLLLAGCEKEDGPAEEIGEEIDNAVDKVKDAAE